MQLLFINQKLKEEILSIKEARATLAHKLKLLSQYREEAHSVLDIKMEERGLFKIALKGRVKLRLYFCYHEDSIVFLHCFIKKSAKTPKKELEKARKALQEVKK